MARRSILFAPSILKPFQGRESLLGDGVGMYIRYDNIFIT